MSSVKANLSSTKGWSPAIIAKRADNIISSDYAKSTRVFTPSYERLVSAERAQRKEEKIYNKSLNYFTRECRPCMDQLIANEYQRIWWQERDAWAKGKTPQTKPKKFGVKAEGSSYNVRMFPFYFARRDYSQNSHKSLTVAIFYTD